MMTKLGVPKSDEDGLMLNLSVDTQALQSVSSG